MSTQSTISTTDLPQLKGCYPFRLGTTSFILPDYRLPNVRFLAPLVDEVELVFFESRRPDSLPAREEINELTSIGRDQGLLYNVHLPLDLFLGDPEESIRTHGVNSALQFIDRTMPLSPTCLVLHLDWKRPDGSGQSNAQAWLTRLRRSLEAILATGISSATLAVENLMYPFDLVTPLLRELNLRYCLDIGHFLLFEPDPLIFFQRHLPLAIMMHVHGVRQGKDHVGLNHLEEPMARVLRDTLRHYAQGVSIEVFNYNDLAESLGRLSEWLQCPDK